MTATASAVTASVDEDLDECGPQLIGKLEVGSTSWKFEQNSFEKLLLSAVTTALIYIEHMSIKTTDFRP